jgi:imidazolonepropionase
MDHVPIMNRAFLCIKEGRIDSFGPMKELPEISIPTLDLGNRHGVIPTWVDSHTHAVHATTRQNEFVDKLRGLSYQEIAAKGGGILNSANRLNKMSFDDLYQRSYQIVQKIIRSGTGALEIKSGYGLTVESEIKMLRVIRALDEAFPIPIKATFLGAHALPLTFKKDKKGYLDLIFKEMLPNIRKEGLADYIDIFCEDGFFNIHDTSQMIEWGELHGLKAKIHVNQFHSIGGVQLATKKGILSVDHLEVLTPEDMESLKNSDVLPVGLPGAAFFLQINRPPLRDMVDNDLPVVLASDFNPGSCPSYNMELMQSLACIESKMLPIEAFHACTINAAYALELEDEAGSLVPGRPANFCILKKDKTLEHISYEFGSECVDQVFIKGVSF